MNLTGSLHSGLKRIQREIGPAQRFLLRQGTAVVTESK
jgi:hypothetical protein